jgi:photosystem II stability/assembly factor-like uncharacterized protein
MAIENDNLDSANDFLVVTDNGGESWSGTPAIGSEPLMTLDSISCVTTSDCWASGAEPLASSITTTASSQGVVFATEVGGQTWHSEQVPTIQGATLAVVGSITCPTVNGCLVLANGPSSSSAFGQQLVLSNQGAPPATSTGENGAVSSGS